MKRGGVVPVVVGGVVPMRADVDECGDEPGLEPVEREERCVCSEQAGGGVVMEGDVKMGRGALRHVLQRRRRRWGKAMGGGGLLVQFWERQVTTLSLVSRGKTHPANHDAALATIAHHVSRALADLAAQEPPPLGHAVPSMLGVGGAGRRGLFARGLVVAAAQRLRDQLVAVFEEVCAELPARAREVVQRIQVEQGCELRDDAASEEPCQRGG